jgi:hypothetical protein
MYNNFALNEIYKILIENEFKSEEFIINIISAVAEIQSVESTVFLSQIYRESPKTHAIKTSYFQSIAKLALIEYERI